MMTTGGALAASVLALLGLGCQSGAACSTTCSASFSAAFDLSCGPSDLTMVTLSGPCSVYEDAANSSGFLRSPTSLQFDSPSPGECQVTLTFATGYRYSATVTFVSQTDPEPSGCPACPAYIAPTQRTFMVDNPNSTCVGVAVDAGVPDASTADALEGAAAD